ncbi:MAG: HYR domain-containing protein [Actinobacteria bacterium]|nr:HYR domain-containing protein [Actinomycetota bacterium]
MRTVGTVIAFSACRALRRGTCQVVIGATLVAGVTLVPLASGSPAGTFALRLELPWEGVPSVCVGSRPPTVQCYAHPGGPIAAPGLGVVFQSYIYPVETQPGSACPGGGFYVMPYSARLIVKGKGEILLTLGAVEGCLQGPPSDTVLSPTQAFTVTGGSGVYAGASGSGVVRRTQVRRTIAGHGAGRDIWEGALIVPNFEFDMKPPTITGAGGKVVRATRKATFVRVRYQPGATDNVDQTVPVACKPRSGSLFKVGRRTLVRCSATDMSANTSHASFTVTVRRQR